MVKKAKVLFLLHLPPPVHGSSVMGLSIKESLIINNEFDSYYINLLASHNVAESGIVNIKKLYGFIIVWFKVLGSLIKNRPQVCYFALTVTGAALYRDLLIILLIKLFRVKLIYHLHNKGVSLYQHRLMYHICYRLVFRNADVILISKLLYDDIKQFVSLEKVHYCTNGIVETDLCFKESLLNSSTISSIEKPIHILFLSNLIKSKGVYVLLEACALLKERQLSFECVFIGGEGDISRTMFEQKKADLGLSDNVNYLGERYGADKNEAFAVSDIFVFPTYYYYETFGLVNLEAMQQSKPVISTFEGGIPDIIEDGVNGFLVPQKNVMALAEKLEILIKDHDLRKKMGLAGRKKYESQFTKTIFEEKLKEILTQILKKEKPIC